MTLQLDGAGRAFRIPAGTAGLGIDVQILVDQYAVVLERHAGIFHLLTVLHYRVGKCHIISLPLQWWQAHVHYRIGFGVNTSTLVVFALESK